MAKRFGTDIISSIANRGKLCFIGYEENFTVKVFVRFLRQLIEDSGELKTQVYSHMRMLQRRPARIQAYFKHPKIRYAAWPTDPYLFVGLIFTRGENNEKNTSSNG